MIIDINIFILSLALNNKMYSDIYSKLTSDEKRVLEIYQKKVAQSQSNKRACIITTKSFKKPARPLFPRDSQDSLNTKKEKLSKLPKSPQNSSKLRKTLSKTASLPRTDKKTSKKFKVPTYLFNEIPDIRYETEKLLRVVYRHCVTCADFKEEIKSVGGLLLLDEYLKYKDLNN